MCSYIDNLARILSDDFVPNEIDILRTRDSTMTSSNEVIQTDANYSIRIYDLGGYKFQRAKWAAQISAVKCDACIYVHSLACYDQKVDDDAATNQMAESIKVYSEFANLDSLKHVPVVLILNKKDLLAEKLKYSNFKDHVPDFQGDSKNQSVVIDYIKSKFIGATVNHHQRNIHIIETNALDIEEMSPVVKMIVGLALANRGSKAITHSL